MAVEARKLLLAWLVSMVIALVVLELETHALRTKTKYR